MGGSSEDVVQKQPAAGGSEGTSSGSVEEAAVLQASLENNIYPPVPTTATLCIARKQASVIGQLFTHITGGQPHIIEESEQWLMPPVAVRGDYTNEVEQQHDVYEWGALRSFLERSIDHLSQIQQVLQGSTAVLESKKSASKLSVETGKVPNSGPQIFVDAIDTKYELGRELHRTPSGVTIYAASHKLSQGQNFAVEMLPKPLHTQSTQMWMQCNHPNILSVLELYDTPAKLMAVIPRHGANISKWFRDRAAQQKPSTEMDVARIAAQLMSALHYLHQRGWVHRRVRPHHILTWRYAEASHNESDSVEQVALRIVLAGNHQLATAGTNSSLQGQWSAYIAPELDEGTPHQPAADVWAAGAVIALLLTGRNLKPAASNLQQLVSSRNLSTEGSDFLISLLKADPNTRLTAAEALQHPWLRGKAAPVKVAPPFDAKTKFKSAIHHTIAARRFVRLASARAVIDASAHSNRDRTASTLSTPLATPEDEEAAAAYQWGQEWIQHSNKTFTRVIVGGMEEQTDVMRAITAYLINYAPVLTPDIVMPPTETVVMAQSSDATPIRPSDDDVLVLDSVDAVIEAASSGKLVMAENTDTKMDVATIRLLSATLLHLLVQFPGGIINKHWVQSELLIKRVSDSYALQDALSYNQSQAFSIALEWMEYLLKTNVIPPVTCCVAFSAILLPNAGRRSCIRFAEHLSLLLPISLIKLSRSLPLILPSRAKEVAFNPAADMHESALAD